ncbi:UvrD-helicase domain-containing protein [Methylocystis sp.]|uniref:UvrD-helicase domain-containing protein n=1 Tax=Methylocystis sp. TaxID=1911079 RepID=UPI003DA21671
MTTAEPTTDDHADDHVDDVIIGCLSLDAPKSFFLFAGAGSGKTRSLVKALDHIRAALGPTLRLRGQRIAVITYTKAARDEIIRRTQFDSVIAVSTIHSFAWSMIQGFNHDIREWLRVQLADDISELQKLETKGRPGTKASADRLASIASKTRRLQGLDTIRAFVYSPDSDNHGRDSLNHAEVLKIVGNFIQTKPVMQRILMDGFPFILIDESQDTSKYLIEALFNLQQAYPANVALGLLGDMMQRIYSDGKDGLGEQLPAGWITPTKKLNFRCPRRVVRLINKIREAGDRQVQIPWSGAVEGHARIFILPTSTVDKVVAERAIASQMATITGDPEWEAEDGFKSLILEHRMAARRMGFEQMFMHLYPIDQFRTGLLDGSLSILTLFSGRVLPLVDAKDDKFATARIVRASSPLLSADKLRAAENQTEVLQKAQAAVTSLLELWENDGTPSFGDVLGNIAATGLFTVPDPLRRVAFRDEASITEQDDPDAESIDRQTERDAAVDEFLNTPFEQIKPYARYVAGAARFDTHQGVKGLEFPRVMVIMDDSESRGFQFKFEKLFGVGTGEDATTASTRRLFYVTCSRAERGLALVAYTEHPERVRQHVLQQGWFTEAEVQLGL